MSHLGFSTGAALFFSTYMDLQTSLVTMDSCNMEGMGSIKVLTSAGHVLIFLLFGWRFCLFLGTILHPIVVYCRDGWSADERRDHSAIYSQCSGCVDMDLGDCSDEGNFFCSIYATRGYTLFWPLFLFVARFGPCAMFYLLMPVDYQDSRSWHTIIGSLLLSKHILAYFSNGF